MPYATFLTIVVILLALGFLIFGIGTLSKRQGWFSAPGQPMNNVSRQGIKLSPLLVLLLPAIVLLVGVSPSVFPPPLATPTPTNANIGSVTPIPTTPTPTVKTITLGTLTVGVSDPKEVSPPETEVNDDGSVGGFDTDLINDIAKAMNLTVTPKPTKLGAIQPDGTGGNLLDGLNNKQFDVVIDAYGLTPQVQNAALNLPYLKPKDVLLVSSGNPKHLSFTKLADLCGDTIGVQDNTSEKAALGQTQCPEGKTINVTPIQKAGDLPNALLNGTVDAIYQGSPTASYYQQINQGKFLQIGAKIPQTYQEGILIRKDNQAMFTAIQNAYNSLGAKYTQLLNNYMISTDDGIPPNPASIPTPTPDPTPKKK